MCTKIGHLRYSFDVKQSEIVHIPYVFIVLPLATTSEVPGFLVQVINPVAGKTLTSALVSTTNRSHEIFPHTNIVGPPLGWMHWPLLLA